MINTFWLYLVLSIDLFQQQKLQYLPIRPTKLNKQTMDSCWITQKYSLVLNCTDLKYIVLLASYLRGWVRTVFNSPVSATGSDFPPVQRCEQCSQSAWSAAAGEKAAAAGSARWSSDTLGWCCWASPAKRTPEEEQDKRERWAFHKIKVCNNYLANGDSLIACNTTFSSLFWSSLS